MDVKSSLISEKAFDALNQFILLRKLGIERSHLIGLLLYLLNRKQYVSVNGHISGYCEITFGVL